MPICCVKAVPVPISVKLAGLTESTPGGGGVGVAGAPDGPGDAVGVARDIGTLLTSPPHATSPQATRAKQDRACKVVKANGRFTASPVLRRFPRSYVKLPLGRLCNGLHSPERGRGESLDSSEVPP